MAARRNNDLYHNLNLNVRGLNPSATLAINEKSNELIREGKKVFRLGLGQSPFPVPSTVVNSLKEHAHVKDYQPVKGYQPLRRAIAEFNRRTQQIESREEDILIGPGSKELIFILQLVYYGELLIPTPSWVSYSPQARIIGRHVNWIQTEEKDKWRLLPEKLERICRVDPDRPRILILNYPSNPTGYTYSSNALHELARIARKYRVVLVSDEIYGMLHFQGQHVSIARYYPEGTIISSGLSKWCGAGGWRLGTFSFPSSLHWLLEAMAVVASETYTATSAPIQYAAVTAFRENAEIDRYLIDARSILNHMARYLVTRLKKISVEVAMPQGAFYLFPNFEHYRNKLEAREILTSVEMCQELFRETGVAMLPGNDFGRRPGEYTARIAFVDFDGQQAMQKIHELSSDKLIDEDFIHRYAHRLEEACDLVEKWFVSL